MTEESKALIRELLIEERDYNARQLRYCIEEGTPGDRERTRHDAAVRALAELRGEK